MRILVAYASRAGSTKGIAEFIGEKLRGHGMEVDVVEVGSVKDPRGYDGYVVGSAVYMFHWMKEAKEFVRQNGDLLSSRPTWLFSSGPTSPKATDAKGRDLKEVSGPSELSELTQAAHPRGHRVFFGALYGDRLTGATGFTYRLMRRSKTVAKEMPEGDYRDWKDIERWTDEIAAALAPKPSVSP